MRKESVLFGVLFSLTLIFVYVSATINPGDLVAHWTLDETSGSIAGDSSGNGLDGALNNGPVWTTSGNINGGLTFDGVDDFVEIPLDSSLDITSTITLSAWVYPSAVGQSQATRFISKRTTPGGSDVYALGFWTSSLNPFFRITSGGDETNLIAINTIPLNTWSYVTGTYDGTTMRLYINGVEDISVAKTGPIDVSTIEVHLGDRKGEALNRRFNGTMDDVRIYDVALDAADIVSIMGGSGSASVCGDGVVNGSEVCDGVNLSGASCSSLGYDSGVLGCSGDCLSYNITMCFTISPVCGNGINETGETCDDGNNVSGDGCDQFCQIEVSPPVCGNGIIEGIEQCDDNNTIETDLCYNNCTDITYQCGNNFVDPGEVCDGTNNNGEFCTDQGYALGTLLCSSDCKSFNLTSCTNCGNGIVDIADGEQCDEGPVGNIDNGTGCSSTCQIEIPPCLLTAAYWSATNATEGDVVTLTVEGTNCEGEEISLEIFEDDLFGFTDPPVTQPSNIIISGGVASTTWVAEYQTDGFTASPEYYFEATVVSDNSISIDSGTFGEPLLEVFELPAGVGCDCLDTDGDGYPDMDGSCTGDYAEYRSPDGAVIRTTFDKDYQCGQYINGDYWVMDDGSGVIVTSTTPALSQASGQWKNGWNIDPPRAETSNDPLTGEGQSLDQQTTHWMGTPASYGKGLPLTLLMGQSFIKAESVPYVKGEPGDKGCSDPPAIQHQTCINSVMVLTIVDTIVPFTTDTFRPPYNGAWDRILYQKVAWTKPGQGSNKPFRYSDVQLDAFPKLDFSTVKVDDSGSVHKSWIEFNEIKNEFRTPHMEWLSHNNKRTMRPLESNGGSDYAAHFTKFINRAWLRFAADDFDPENNLEHKLALVNTLQIGIDQAFLTWKGDNRYYADGGHYGGGYIPSLMTCHVFDKTNPLGYDVSEYCDYLETNKIEVDGVSHPEWGEVAYVYRSPHSESIQQGLCDDLPSGITCAEADIDPLANVALYGQKWAARPNSDASLMDPEKPGRGLCASWPGNTVSTHCRDPFGYIDHPGQLGINSGQGTSNYDRIINPGIRHAALIGRIYGVMQLDNSGPYPNRIWDYSFRRYFFGYWMYPDNADSTAPGTPSSYGSTSGDRAVNLHGEYDSFTYVTDKGKTGGYGPGQTEYPPVCHFCRDVMEEFWNFRHTFNEGNVCVINSDCPILECKTSATCVANVCEYTNEVDGTSCTDDSLYCSGAETCSSGSCVSEGNPCLGDSYSCTSVSCNEGSNSCDPIIYNDALCNDANSCTLNTCIGVGGDIEGCGISNLTGSCDDGDACTIGDSCSVGICLPSSTITSFINGDGCCPVGADGTTDSDCVSGFVAHYKLDGNFIDSSGNENDGSCTNCPINTIDKDGNVDSAYSFDGTNFIDLNNMDVNSGVITIATWVKLDDLDENIRFISKANGIAYDSHYWMIGERNGYLRFRLKAGGVTETLVAVNGPLQTGVWFHAAAVYDGSDMTLYLDGVEVDTVAHQGSVDTDSSVPVWIGGSPDGTNYVNGAMDDVRIYDVALSASEIATLAGGMVSGPSQVCGDSVVNGSEICEVGILGGATCVSQGFDSGTLGCSANCLSYDTSSCVVAANNLPVLTSIGSKNISEGDDLFIILSGNDSDGDPLSYGANNLPAGSDFDELTRTFTWTPSFSSNGTYFVTFSVTDGNGGMDFEIVTITVNDVLVVLDGDSDGVPDSSDKCPNTPALATVNPTNGCRIPLYTKFHANLTTDFSLVKDLLDMNNFSLGIWGKGRIEFIGRNMSMLRYDGTRHVPLNLDLIVITNNLIGINTGFNNYTGFDKPARLTFYNVFFGDPQILRDGVLCSGCVLLGNASGVISFSVPGFSNYTIEETLVSDGDGDPGYDDPAPPSGSGPSGGPSGSPSVISSIVNDIIINLDESNSGAGTVLFGELVYVIYNGATYSVEFDEQTNEAIRVIIGPDIGEYVILKDAVRIIDLDGVTGDDVVIAYTKLGDGISLYVERIIGGVTPEHPSTVTEVIELEEGEIKEDNRWIIWGILIGIVIIGIVLVIIRQKRKPRLVIGGVGGLQKLKNRKAKSVSDAILRSRDVRKVGK